MRSAPRSPPAGAPLIQLRAQAFDTRAVLTGVPFW
jgi:hypothetical protein